MAQLPKRGIDISEFNGNVDIAALKGQVDFVIIRCGYGSDLSNQDDPQFEANVKKCQEAGVPWGTYLYSYAKTPEMARSEAQHTLRLLKGKKPSYGVWYDVEDTSLPTGTVLVDNVVAYCQAIQKAGYYCGVYASLSWLETRLNSPRLDGYDKWVAQWSSKNTYTKPYGIWQYTDQLRLNGKLFDGNLAYKDYPALTGAQEVKDMTQAEVERIAREQAQKVYQANLEKYPTIASLPAWAKEAVKQVYQELELAGTGGSGDSTRIDASETYVRTLVVIAKVLDKMSQQ
ncbi:MAG: glycoside hydrolase family 25 protein [Acutalibacter sp.]|jgi:GH25 family lysozyme M1 (1,4-beta-N-acetylmuramidase)